MESTTYAAEAEVELSHWWFVGRRRLFARLIERHGIARDASVLDIGTSTGTNLRLLKAMGFANVVGLDSSDEAIRWCAEKALGEVRKGDVCALPFQDGQFKLVMATDIIEHVDDDAQALREIRRVLAPGGVALISVPAFRSLWGLQDEVSLHKRRYTQPEVLTRVADAGLSTLSSFHFNYMLFVPIWIARRLIRLFGIALKSENNLNSPLVNRILTAVFALDVRTAEVLRPPFGVSIMIVARAA